METRDKMQIELVTENPDYGSGYFYAPLYLPATDADVRDAVQRARGLGRKDRYEDISVTDCPRLPALEDTRLDAPTIRELHFFASRLEELSEEELTVLNAVFKKRRDAGSFDDGLTMKDLINLTYGLSGVPVASNVRSDEQLGQLVIDSEMNEDVTSVPENARYLLDKARIGRLIRQNEDGVYLNGKCVLTSFYEMPEVYDGVQLPEKLHAIPDGFWLQIAKGPFDASKRPVYDADDPDERAIWISLPIGREEADGFARELGESRIEDCVFYGFETAVQQIGPGKFGSMRNFDTLNEIASRFDAMSESEQIKYKAVLIAQEYEGKHQLSDALEAAKHIGEYELAYYADSNSDFAAEYLAHHLPTGFDTEWLRTFQAADMGAKLLDRLGARCTEYGVVSARGKSLFELVPFEEPQNKELKSQAMTDEKLEVVEVLGQTALFSNGRYTEAEVPEGFYKYELREGESISFATIEKSVTVNHSGTVFTKAPLDFGGETYFVFDDDSSPNFLGYEMTAGEFLHTDFTQQENQENGGIALE